jgi:hypothetical protein
MDIQHEHGHVAWTWTYSIDNGHVNAAWTWTCSINIDMDILHGHERAAWRRTYMDMHNGHDMRHTVYKIMKRNKL